jgi:copper(I)-binding protein
MRSRILAGTLLTAVAIGLGSCGQGANQSEPTATAPDGFPGITVSDGRLVLPAVKGNPGALYFNLDYTGNDIAMIRAVHVDGAQDAELHESTKNPNGVVEMHKIVQLAVPKGQTLKFEPGGNHVMVLKLDDTLKAGGTTEATLTFAGGDKTSFPAKIEPAGSAR